MVSYMLWGMGEIPEQFLGGLFTIILLQIVGIIAYSALALTVALLIRGTALSLVVNVVIVTLMSNVFFLLDLITKERFHIVRYWIINAMSESASFTLTNGQIVRNLATMVVTFVIAYVIGVVTFQKADVK
jgi:hypothetical protein